LTINQEEEVQMKDLAHASAQEVKQQEIVKEIVTVLRRNGYLGGSEGELSPHPEPPDVVTKIIAVLLRHGYVDGSEAWLSPQPEPPDVVGEIIDVLRQHGYHCTRRKLS
jgi:hypothetical protein